MRIADILTPERVVCSSGINSKKVALEELARMMAGADPALSPTDIYACLNARERLGSTGLGHGIAIPHGRYGRINQPVGALLKLQQGVDYGSVDQKPVGILFSLLVPDQSTEDHLQLLALLAGKFSDAKSLEHLQQAQTPQELYTLITG